MIGQQLPLSVQLPDAASFDNFHAGPNAATLAVVVGLARGGLPGPVLLHGPAGSGRTHLLQAASRAAAALPGRRAAYLPLASFRDEAPEALRGFESLDLVCLDDVDSALHERTWAYALLRLLDALRARGGQVLMSALAPPATPAVAPTDDPTEDGPTPAGDAAGERETANVADGGVVSERPSSSCTDVEDTDSQRSLPDLRTRLSAAAAFALKPLDDEDRAALLRVRAGHRGLELSDEVIDFLLRRLPRDVRTLVAAVESLDRDALQLKRRLTIPFVQQVLAPLLPAPAPPAARTAPG